MGSSSLDSLPEAMVETTVFVDRGRLSIRRCGTLGRYYTFICCNYEKLLQYIDCTYKIIYIINTSKAVAISKGEMPDDSNV